MSNVPNNVLKASLLYYCRPKTGVIKGVVLPYFWKYVFVFSLLVIAAFASDPQAIIIKNERAAGFSLGSIILQLIFYSVLVIPTLILVLLQTKLLKVLTSISGETPSYRLWVWSQLLPLWNLIAFAMTTLIIRKVYKNCLPSFEEQGVSINFNFQWSWLFLTTVIVTGILVPLQPLILPEYGTNKALEAANAMYDDISEYAIYVFTGAYLFYSRYLYVTIKELKNIKSVHSSHN